MDKMDKMSLLQSLTVKIRSKFSPTSSAEASPTAASRSSFEVISGRKVSGREEGRKREGKGHRRMDSFMDDYHASKKVVVEERIGTEMTKTNTETKAERRRSRFREEFGE